jgi:hypothetical protein
VASWLGSLRQHVALPQPPESEEGETIRGVPVVNMHDDPAELELFLKAMFDPEYTALLRLGIPLGADSTAFDSSKSLYTPSSTNHPFHRSWSPPSRTQI